jgi:hypothetical protein
VARYSLEGKELGVEGRQFVTYPQPGTAERFILDRQFLLNVSDNTLAVYGEAFHQKGSIRSELSSYANVD